jgi:hypothetical protein
VKNEAIIHEVVNHSAGTRAFFLDEPRLIVAITAAFDRNGDAYTVYRAKVAPLSHKRWVKLMTMICNERRHEIPFFHNAEVIISSRQSVATRMRFRGDTPCRLRLIDCSGVV